MPCRALALGTCELITEEVMKKLIAGLALMVLAFSATAQDSYSQTGYLSKNGMFVDASSPKSARVAKARGDAAQVDTESVESVNLNPTPATKEDAKKLMAARQSVFSTGLKSGQ